MDAVEKERIMINVQGKRYETYLTTLDHFPNTLLGSKISRSNFHSHESSEIILDRDKEIFDSILFYYQSKGILAKPEFVSEEMFQAELDFFDISNKKIGSKITKSEISQTNETYMLEWIWNLLEKPDSSNVAGFLGKLNLCVIVVSTIVYCLETIKDVRKQREFFFFVMESIFVAWFTIEYLLRLVSAPIRTSFIFSALGIIDLLAILPYYVTISIESKKESGGKSLAAFRFVRMIRICRMLKISRYNRGLRVLAKAIASSKRQIKSLLLCLVIVTILISSIIYHVEELFSNGMSCFNSIPDVFWFTIVTMTSVGYGDVVPITILGKVSAVFCFISGIILLLSLPVPIFISHFKTFYKKEGGT